MDEDDRTEARARSKSKRLRPRPRPRYLLKELLGWNSVNDKYLYVTDGGHYENLGLVELLRRGCTKIYCLDASGRRGRAESRTSATRSHWPEASWESRSNSRQDYERREG